MKKTTTILFLGLALVSVRAFAQTDNLFNSFIQEQEAVAPAAEMESSHPLIQGDDEFLSEIEAMQKNITLMQLELKEAELEYKVKDQAKKLDNLENPPVIEVVSEPIKPATGILDSFMPGASSSMDGEYIDPSISVASIKGLEGELRATVTSEEIGVNVVSKGDVLNNGAKVANITQNTVTLEAANGDVETIGISLKR